MEQPQIYYRIYSKSRPQLTKQFTTKEQELKVYNTFTIRANRGLIRAAVFNVHGFAEAIYNPAEFVSTIAGINADILGIVEFNTLGDMKWFSSIGYNYWSNYGTLTLFSRFPIIGSEYHKIGDDRYVLNTGIMMGHNILHIYLTHFDYQSQDKRLANATELIRYYKSRKDTNVIIMGDLNHVSPTESDVEFKDNYENRTGQKYSGVPISLLYKYFKDSFQSGRPPYSTHWTGTRIDYIMYDKNSSIVPANSYVYHCVVSDHIPVIFDFMVGCGYFENSR